MMVPSRSRKTARFILIGPRDELLSVSPHPGPLPWGAGESCTAPRSLPCRILPNDHRLNTNQTFEAWGFFGVWGLGFGVSDLSVHLLSRLKLASNSSGATVAVPTLPTTPP